MKTYHEIRWPDVVRGVLVVTGMLALLLGANLLSLHWHNGPYRFAMGDGVDRLLIENFYQVEEDRQGVRYRWTLDRSSLKIRGFASVSSAFVRLKVGGLPPALTPRPVAVHIEGEQVMTFSVGAFPRTFALVLPPAALRDGSLDLTLHTEATKVPPDRRNLGIRIDEVEIGWFSPAFPHPPLPVLLVQGLIVAVVVFLLWRVALPRWSIAAVAGVIIFALGWMSGSLLLFASSWQTRILASLLAMLLVFLVVSPRLPERGQGQGQGQWLRWLWLITFVALGVRMVCILYPSFASHDWYIHLRRIVDFVGGQFLIYDHPAEFSKKLTIVPPAPYLLYTPALLVVSNPIVAMQWVYAFLDSLTTLLVGLLVRRIGGSGRAAWLAALVVALFPLHFTALWWGFGPQAIGQHLVVLLALFVAQRHIAHSKQWSWLVAGGATILLLFSHIGAGILGGFWLVGFIALAWLFERSRYPHWKGWGLVVILSGIVVTLLLYSEVLELQLRGLSGNERIRWDEDDLFRVPWTLLSLYPSFHPLGVAVPVVSMAVLVWATRSIHRWLVVAWLTSAGGFFVVDLLTGLQVRYAYFLMPMIAAGLALLLDRLIRRHRAGWLIAWAFVGLVGLAGLSLWLEGILGGVKPSLRGLTH